MSTLGGGERSTVAFARTLADLCNDEVVIYTVSPTVSVRALERTFGIPLHGITLRVFASRDALAAELRRLVGEQLPGFVADYTRVPPAMRGTPRNGMTPDQQLVEGLGVIERELGEISERLAQGDLDALETKRRYLQVKYEEDAASGE